ncbi:ATP-dependent DNA helicase [Lachnoclostridium phytofermentans]|uniref:Helicase c2 n=1 Tax=Lachnoclostridium phytofermentans (strain ATCC 700394 / DSM 18823 / ISDg) TaxID=357809 RepID=A9KQK5_LACP7|nr:ATP-dependent DNA helicase [Lachnoclostridium phytofermentans]ABX41918.1 helicase c2 [Lachnoclostridium phytofermentans ISDg]
MCARRKEPFDYKNKQEFQVNLVEWIGDVLYDLLPEHGYEIRDEQIFTAFKIADAVCNKKVHLAEAGLGTGKTFAYLLSAIPYARFTGKPVVIACATTALQEQLAGSEGDIRTLSRLLGLEIDARMAKDPHQYICDVRVDENMEEFGAMSSEINEWLSNTKLGERSEIPYISDHEWKKIKWVEYMACDICSSRGFCKLVKAREQYRLTKDLLIVDHETFFHDLWTREERLANGLLPILPDYSAVIFDEGHKVLLPASMQAGQQINKDEIDTMISDLEEIQGARASLASIITTLENATNSFFTQLQQSVIVEESTERVSIQRSDALLKAATTFRKTLDHLLLEMQIEQELYTDSLSSNQIQAYEGQIERAIWALDKFCRNQGSNIVSWVEQKDGSFWVVPRRIGDMLNKHLFQKKIPVVFTSATLSNKGDFDYFIRTLGLEEPSKSTIGSPFDLENQVVVYLPKTTNKIKHLVSLLNENGGRALVLTNSLHETKKIRRKLQGYHFPFEMIWEDTGERGYLVREFREEETSVLIGSNFWEGIDVPGEALNLLIIWELPLNVRDPLIEIQRKEAREQGLDPLVIVDYPEMVLKLKQGCGRLIRTEEDNGAIVILDPVIGTPWESYVMGALPSGARIEKQ